MAVFDFVMLLVFVSCAVCLLNAFETHSVVNCNMTTVVHWTGGALSDIETYGVPEQRFCFD
jgi:hypothetical protein